MPNSLLRGTVRRPYLLQIPQASLHTSSHVLLFSCLNKNLFFCSLVFQNNLFFCSYVFKKTMFLCSLVSQKKHVLLFSCLSKKNMFFCPPTALNFYQVAHNRIAHKQPLSRQPQVVVAQFDSAVA